MVKWKALGIRPSPSADQNIFTSIFSSISSSSFLFSLTTLVHFLLCQPSWSLSASRNCLPPTKLSAEENLCTQSHIWDKLQQPGEVGKRQQYLFLLLISISNIGIPQPLSQARYFFEVDAESSPSERFSLPWNVYSPTGMTYYPHFVLSVICSKTNTDP